MTDHEMDLMLANKRAADAEGKVFERDIWIEKAIQAMSKAWGEAMATGQLRYSTAALLDRVIASAPSNDSPESEALLIHLYECGHLWGKDANGIAPERCPVCDLSESLKMNRELLLGTYKALTDLFGTNIQWLDTFLYTIVRELDEKLKAVDTDGTLPHSHHL